MDFDSHDSPREHQNENQENHQNSHLALACSKRNKTLVIFVVLLALCSVGLVSYIIYDKCFAPDQSVGSADIDNCEKTAAENPTNSEDAVADDNFTFASATDDGRTYRLEANFGGVSVSQKDPSDFKTFTVILDYYNQTAVNTFGTDPYLTNRSDQPSADLTFSQDVREVIATMTGQDAAGSFIAFLLADGTVEYLPVLQCLQNGQAYTKKVENLSGISHLLTASASEPGGGDYITTLAQQSNGTFYNLADYNLDLTYKN